jgi:hypothetical protein
MTVLADGQQRFAVDGDYRGIAAALAIGPCFGSTVTLGELSVAEG